ncbi:hypothetical protein HDU99_010337, partial [Rhizoclosmatium hyalinum]
MPFERKTSTPFFRFPSKNPHIALRILPYLLHLALFIGSIVMIVTTFPSLPDPYLAFIVSVSGGGCQTCNLYPVEEYMSKTAALVALLGGQALTAL